MEAHNAQPTTTDTFDVVAYLDDHVVCRIEAFRLAMATTKPTRKQREYWYRQLSGAVGALITIQNALK